MPSAKHPLKTALALFEALNNADIEAALSAYAESAVLNHPFGRFSGKQAIRDFYTGTVLAAKTVVTVGATLEQGQACGVQLTAVSPLAPDNQQRAFDYIEVDEDGLIKELTVYYLTDMTKSQ